MQDILIIEDIPETGVWLCGLIRTVFPHAEIQLCQTRQATLQILATPRHWGLVLLDIHLPDGEGLSLIPALLDNSPDAHIVISTIFDDEQHILTALQLGAKGYLLKESSDAVFIQKLRGILTGDPPLSPSIARKILRHFNHPDPLLEETKLCRNAPAPRLPHEAHLSPRETDVLVLVAKGYSRKEVARLLDLSSNTVSSYVRDIYQKLGISSRAEAAMEACRMGLIDPKA